MRGSFFTFAAVAAACAVAGPALAQQQGQNPVCQRLEAQLVSLDRGNADPQRADQIRRAEDAVNRQQFEVDKLVSQSRQMGCERSGFFSIFSNPPPQCGALALSGSMILRICFPRLRSPRVSSLWNAAGSPSSPMAGAQAYSQSTY